MKRSGFRQTVGSFSPLERHCGGGDRSYDDGGRGFASSGAGCPGCILEHTWRFLCTLVVVTAVSPVTYLSFRNVSYFLLSGTMY